MTDPTPSTPREQSERFTPPPTRRDFLGLAAKWSAVTACLGALIGSLRLPMPALFPESSAKVKVGTLDAFQKGSEVHLADLSLWILHDDERSSNLNRFLTDVCQYPPPTDRCLSVPSPH